MRRFVWLALACSWALILVGCGHTAEPKITTTIATTATVPVPPGATAITSVTTTPAATIALAKQAQQNELAVYRVVQHLPQQTLTGKALLTAIVRVDPQLAAELSLAPTAAYPRIGIGSSKAHDFIAISAVSQQPVIFNQAY
jgi:hypothetical protein